MIGNNKDNCITKNLLFHLKCNTYNVTMSFEAIKSEFTLKIDCDSLTQKMVVKDSKNVIEDIEKISFFDTTISVINEFKDFVKFHKKIGKETIIYSTKF